MLRYHMRCCLLRRRGSFGCKFLAFLLCLIPFVILTRVFDYINEMIDVNDDLGFSKTKTTTLRTPISLEPGRLKRTTENKKYSDLMSEKNKTNIKIKIIKDKIEKLNKMMKKSAVDHLNIDETIPVNENVHIFYYAWYGNLAVDGKWEHWNHEILKSWKKDEWKVYPTGRHNPPSDIGSNYYPKLGCYSSRDPKVMEEHLKQIKEAGIGVLIVSWYPPGMSDGSHKSPDTIFPQLLNAAQKHGLKICPHIEPFKGRNPETLIKYLKYFTGTYGGHSALYRLNKGGKDLIVYYVYDSYRIPALSWREMLDPKGNITVRGTEQDGVFIGHLVNADHKYDIKRARFDGLYTYFAINGFSYGSTWKNWKTLSYLCKHQKLIFVPSLGPGYTDTRIRPWNSANTRHRSRGKYYEVGWRSGINAAANWISITSFNEWHEGTQIEPAVPKKISGFTYSDYEPENSYFYMNLTKYWVNKFSNKILGHSL